MRDQSDSEKLSPLFNAKPEKHKQQPAFPMPIHHEEPFRCAFCKNRNLQAFSTVYGHGTSLAK
jgi:hypothetical protein